MRKVFLLLWQLVALGWLNYLEQIVKLLDEETWLSAQEAVDYGLADEVLESNKAVASLPGEFLERYKHVPSQLINKSAPQSSMNREQLIVKAKEKINYVNDTLGGITLWQLHFMKRNKI